MKGPLQCAITLANRGGRIDIQGRAELFCELVNGHSIAVELVVLVSKPGGSREHEVGIVTARQLLAISSWFFALNPQRAVFLTTVHGKEFQIDSRTDGAFYNVFHTLLSLMLTLKAKS